MNKTVALKIKSNGAKGLINVGTKKPTLASLLAQQTPEKKAATQARIREIFGEEEDAALYEDFEANREKIIERHKLTWEHIKALQEAWKELGIPDSVVYKSNP
jgi:hypothetical protein